MGEMELCGAKENKKVKIKIEGGKDERDVLSLMFFQVNVEISIFP
jgi:hypothetical protein